MAKEDSNSLRTTVKVIEQISSELGSFQFGSDHRAIMMIIQEKFPSNIIYRVEKIRLAGDKGWNLDRILRILYHIIEAKESAGNDMIKRTRKLNGERRPPKKRPISVRKPSFYKVTVNQTKERKLPCVFCKGNNYSSEYQVYKKLDQRKKRAYKLELRVRCLRTGHQFKNCQMGRNDYHCRKNHNSAFCERFGNQLTDKSLNEKEEKREGTQMSTLEVKLVTERETGEASIPVVKTVVSSPVNDEMEKETHLFFDSGSHCSFISNKLTQELNLPVIRKELLMLHMFAARNLLKCYPSNVEANLHLCDGTQVKLGSSVKDEMTSELNIRLKNNDDALAASQFVKPDIVVGVDYY